MYGGLGQSIGAIIGGQLSQKVGISKAFYYSGTVDLGILILFIIYQIILKNNESIISIQSNNKTK